MNYVKYPRTPHLPFSPGSTNDDKVLKNLNHFHGKKVVVTAKMDGECTTMYRDKIFARSIDSKDHVSRHWVKNLHAVIKYNINDNYRICGENLYAVHSIKYKHLKDYFYVFSVWNNNSNICMDWEFTSRLVKKSGLTLVPVLYEGIFDEEVLISLSELKELDGDPLEGYVVRTSKTFHYTEFYKNVAKFVRENHVTTSKHWMYEKMVKNELTS